MKKYFILLFFFSLGSFFSCTNENNDPNSILLGDWELIKVIGGRTGFITLASELEYTEKYQFKKDGTFSKTSTRIGTDALGIFPIESFGSYQVIPATQPDRLLDIILSFDTNLQIAASCDPAGIERIYISKESSLVNKSWTLCDGPSFYFIKIGNDLPE